MFLSRRSLAAAALLSALWVLPAPPASSQSAAAPPGGTIPGGTIVVVPLTVTPGTPIATAEAGMKEITAFIKAQPGLIEQSLMASRFPGNRPSHIDVTRWRSLKDWEALSDSPEFLSLMKSKAALFEWRPAEVFVPVD